MLKVAVANRLTRSEVPQRPESAWGRRDFAPPRGKVDQSGHIRTQSALRNPWIFGVSEGFKSLLPLRVSGRFNDLRLIGKPLTLWGFS